jgi:hypothetical protein
MISLETPSFISKTLSCPNPASPASNLNSSSPPEHPKYNFFAARITIPSSLRMILIRWRRRGIDAEE